MRQIVFIVLILSALQSMAQKTLEIDGRLQGMPVYMANNKSDLSLIGIQSDQLLTYTELNNRINMRWYPINKLSFEAGIRNNYTFGNMLYQVNKAANNLYNELLTIETGYLNLTKTWYEDANGVFYTNVDRLFTTMEFGNLNVKLGRQRINWGIGMVWQPNDIFNSFNYLNFNYPERPGSDAIRLQYYTGYTSGFDAAYKIDSQNRSSYALKYALNHWNYDWQLMGGVMNQEYYVAGLGWSGDIRGAGFNGEASYFKPIAIDTELKETLLATVSLNYTFANSLFINFSALYNSQGTTGNAGRGFFSLIDNISALDYTLSKGQLFGQVSYPLTPLINADISSIINPFDGSFYLGPSIDFSLSDDVSFYVIAQTFFGAEGTEYGDFGQMFFGQISWNFSN
jgi:hypothetical protein